MTYIKLFFDDLDAIELLGDAERGRLFTALLEYGKTGEAPQLNGNERFIFPMMRARLDRDMDAYNDEIEARRNAGRKGGEAKANNAKQNLAMLSNAKQSQAVLSKRSKDKDKDEEKDEDKDEDKDSIYPPVPDAPARENPELAKVMTFFLDRINPAPSPTCIDLLRQYTASLSADVVLHALEIAIDERKTAWSYIQAILSQYERDGVRDMDGVKRREQERQQRRETATPPTRRMSKTEEYVNMGRNHTISKAQMDSFYELCDQMGVERPGEKGE